MFVLSAVGIHDLRQRQLLCQNNYFKDDLLRPELQRIHTVVPISNVVTFIFKTLCCLYEQAVRLSLYQRCCSLSVRPAQLNGQICLSRFLGILLQSFVTTFFFAFNNTVAVFI